MLQALFEAMHLLNPPLLAIVLQALEALTAYPSLLQPMQVRCASGESAAYQGHFSPASGLPIKQSVWICMDLWLQTICSTDSICYMWAELEPLPVHAVSSGIRPCHKLRHTSHGSLLKLGERSCRMQEQSQRSSPAWRSSSH